jgi:hypothetical protein
MNKRVQLACEATVRTIDVASILPLRKISKGTKSTVKYRQISASMREIGIIEPIVVHPQDGENKQYMLLDGHMRLEILKETGVETVECLIAVDDEAFTYNHKVNRLTAIQEHFMIMKAIKSGVSEQDIARALDVDVAKIRKKRDLLVGICKEAVELLKGKRANSGTFTQLRKVKPMRQIEMAELMRASHNFSVSYAKCLVAATPANQLIDYDGQKHVDGLSPADMARMEREMESLSGDFKQIEETHGKNVLNLVIVVGYLKNLLDNARVVRYIAQNYPEILTEFQKIVESRTLEDPAAEA